MHPEPIKTEAMPLVIGPYSQVVRLGDLLFVSGQGGLDPETGEPPPGGFPAEGRQALRNLARALEAAGSGLGEVAKVTVYLTRRRGTSRRSTSSSPSSFREPARTGDTDRAAAARPADLDRGRRRSALAPSARPRSR